MGLAVLSEGDGGGEEVENVRELGGTEGVDVGGAGASEVGRGAEFARVEGDEVEERREGEGGEEAVEVGGGEGGREVTKDQLRLWSTHSRHVRRGEGRGTDADMLHSRGCNPRRRCTMRSYKA